MTKLRPVVLTAVSMVVCLFSACHLAQPVTSQCDCSIFPPKQGCDTTCGIATGVVESVSGNSVVIKVPVIQAPTAPTAGQHQGAIAPAESATIQRRTFTLNPAEAAQMANLKPGSHVALTFRQEAGQQVVKSIQSIQAPPKTQVHP